MRHSKTSSAFLSQAKFYLSCALAFVLAFGCLAGSQVRAQRPPATATTPAPERTRLEVIEDLSESLANDLLELSIATRDRDLERTAQFFPARLDAATYPARPQPLKDAVKWVKTHDWIAAAPDTVTVTRNGTLPPFKITTPGSEVAKTPRTMTREEFMSGWAEFLAHFSEIEDARFKVKEANFDESAQAVAGAKEPTAVVGAMGKARVAFYVIGRDVDGKREWARGVANVRVRYDASKRWQFDSFALASLDSMVAVSDIFSEVAIPAGV
ncbi:MAG TPA: hypothetical protein VEY11_07290, partial [Pyrinomonadaceae bacterium]|nr:hypothetical protein [Pyrinomonadaceae bacterium]